MPWRITLAVGDPLVHIHMHMWRLQIMCMRADIEREFIAPL